MYVRVVQLRDMGARRRPRDVHADEGVYGRLNVCIVANHPVMQLYKWGPPNIQSPDILFPLFQPTITSFSELGMIVRGLQHASMSKDAAAPTCLQEWSILFERDAPTVGGAGQRLK